MSRSIRIEGGVLTRTTITTPEMAKLTGLSYRQVDYWSRTGILFPVWEGVTRGSGGRRVFPRSQLRVVLALRYLFESSWEMDRELAQRLHMLEGPWQGKTMALGVEGPVQTVLDLGAIEAEAEVLLSTLGSRRIRRESHVLVDQAV